jgi:hypothetical protein
VSVGDADRPELEKRVRRAPSAAAGEPPEPLGDTPERQIETLGRLAARLRSDPSGPRGHRGPRGSTRWLLLPAVVIVALLAVLAVALLL